MDIKVWKRCFQYDKDTKMKANHNHVRKVPEQQMDVSNTTKILGFFVE